MYKCLSWPIKRYVDKYYLNAESWSVVQNDGLHVFLTVNAWYYDGWLLKSPLNDSALLSSCCCSKIWYIAAVNIKGFIIFQVKWLFKFIPQITYLSAVIEDTIRIIWRRDGSLCHDSVYRSVDVWCLHSIPVNAIMMTNQITVSDKSPPTQVTLIVLTCGCLKYYFGILKSA